MGYAMITIRRNGIVFKIASSFGRRYGREVGLCRLIFEILFNIFTMMFIGGFVIIFLVGVIFVLYGVTTAVVGGGIDFGNVLFYSSIIAGLACIVYAALLWFDGESASIFFAFCRAKKEKICPVVEVVDD